MSLLEIHLAVVALEQDMEQELLDKEVVGQQFN
jgi:hypothetical protein